MKHNNQGQEPRQQMTLTFNYRSKFEARIAASLIKKNVSFSYESVLLQYQINSKYCPDFVLKNGVLVETKGHFSQEDRRKMVAVKTQHPDLDIRLCFQNAAVKLTKKKNSMTYGEWATRHGFKWSSNTIPPDWYN